MKLVAVDNAAARLGLAPNQSLSDARAVVPTLQAREIDHELMAAIFADFADWHSYASPIVAVLSDIAPYGDLVLDITGASHLFGGEARLMDLVTQRLRALGFSVGAAIAPTIGAAWALAHFSPGQILSGQTVEDLLPALAGLPVAALRLTQDQIEGLGRMGLKQVGQLYDRDRKSLQARFTDTLIRRFDQALGLAVETIKPRLPPVEHFTERRFAEPVGLIDDVLMTAQDLAVRLSLQLEAKGLGAQGFHLFLYRVDHKLMTLSVNAARATRDAGHIARLFSNRAERLAGEFDAGFGIDMIRLAADTLSSLDAAQTGAFEIADGAADLDRLYDRMASRLGGNAVLRLTFVNSHMPERAEHLVPALASPAAAPEVLPPGDRPRPLRLLPHPELIEIIAPQVPDGPPAGMVWRRITYRFLKASTAERIGEEWWRADFTLSTRTLRPPTPEEAAKRKSKDPIEEIHRHHVPARDYFIAEDDGGRRFWLFRDDIYTQTSRPNWFLHGFFA